jgi:hypothetical protein
VKSGPFDNSPRRGVDQSPLRAAVTEVTAQGAEGEIGALARSDVIALGRLRDYQGHIDRASALLHRLQPDLVAGETVSIREAELSRSNWPFILAICASGFFWLGIAWAVAALV